MKTRIPILWIVIIVSAIALWPLSSGLNSGQTDNINYSQFVDLIREGQIQSTPSMPVTFAGNRVKGHYAHSETQSEQSFQVVIPKGSEERIVNTLNEKGVIVKVDADDPISWLDLMLAAAIPLILFVGIVFFFRRQIDPGGKGVLSLGKSRAKLWTPQHKEVTFEDVAGVEEAKEELQEIVEFLKTPQKLQRLGGRIPKGVLLVGPPGTGKTLLAQAIAGESQVPFFSISGSDFVELFVGVGASRVRDLFGQGKKHAPCIIFVDEIDAVGRHRGAGLAAGHDEREQTLNQLLVEMDGFESNEGVILMAATNRPDILDPALLRPGRFDRQVVIALPDIQGREGILRVHTRRIPLAEDVDISLLARGTSGLSGAHLANMVNEAALNAAGCRRKAVEMVDFEEARDKVLMGKERKSLVISEREKLSTAYREAGHALVASLLPQADPLHKVTILPRGRALGATVQLPAEDTYHYTKEYMEVSVAVLLAGRCAEEISLGSLTTGASTDLERVTELARKMVCEWGMSEEMGPLHFGKNKEPIFLGREITRHLHYSGATAAKIDQEVKRIVLEEYARAREILQGNRETLVRLAKALLEYETLDSHEVNAVVQGETIRSDPQAKNADPPKDYPTRVLTGAHVMTRSPQSGRKSS